VGFRPTVFRVATSLGLVGWVVNDADGVTVEVEGAARDVGGFLPALERELPQLARIDHVEEAPVDPAGDTRFEVHLTADRSRRSALVPPDAAVCDDCRREMDTPSDRRAGYPFTTCTNCGPRFSIVHGLPYDRSRTSMARFPLCDACRTEYEDPADRRFHTEPVCCPACGPRLWLASVDGRRIATDDDAIRKAVRALLDGGIVAIKGIGGFQIACRADDERSVARLRERKRRPRKPFAVMVRDEAAAARLVTLTQEDLSLLRSPRSPIVLAPRQADAPVCDGVAPGVRDLGVLVPTTPLHRELFRDQDLPPLVMTSGNRSEEPLCRGNREAHDRLGDFVDLLLLHDRDVVRRIDDSVVRSTTTGPVIIRRARGWVPEPVRLPIATPEPVLAVGGHLQVTACVAVDDQAFLSQHVGDLDSESSRSFLREVIDGLEQFLEVRPRIVAADAHPDYPSAWLAAELVENRGGRLIEIQHHLAHAAAVLGEHDRFPDPDTAVTALALDGTGYGDDGSAWGGEWIRLDGRLRWARVASLEPLPLIGGDAAVREPWRVAVAALAAVDAVDLLDSVPLGDRISRERRTPVARLADDARWPRSTGAGRAFEAVGALLGLAVENDWEGEAAAVLEAAAADAGELPVWPDLALTETGGRPCLPTAALIANAARRAADGEPVGRVAAGFHATFADLATELSRHVSPPGAVVVCGGGCLVNRILRQRLSRGLEEAGLRPLLATTVPPGDGGLAYGQAVAAAASLARGTDWTRADVAAHHRTHP
jgi:hydrogenase maturation protein HypF